MDTPSSPDPLALILRKIESVERRLGALESSAAAPLAPASLPAPERIHQGCTVHPEPPQDDSLWVLRGIKERYDGEGVIVFAGQAPAGAGSGKAEFQWGRPADHLSGLAWESSADALAALGHPLRMQMLQAVYLGTETVSALVQELQLGSTGLAYHHLNQLLAAGWIVSPSRGKYQVPITKVVPLLAIITALDSFNG